MKRLLCGLSIVLLVLFMVSPAAFAADLQGTYASVDAANQKIEELILTAQQAADLQLAGRSVVTGNDRAAINHEIKAIIDNLISETNAISRTVIEDAAANGITVVCTYVKVEVGGRKVRIDPLIVCDA